MNILFSGTVGFGETVESRLDLVRDVTAGILLCSLRTGWLLLFFIPDRIKKRSRLNVCATIVKDSAASL